MNVKRGLRKGQTMVEYILIVCLVATLLVSVFSIFSKAIGKKVAGATAALSESEGQNAKAAVENMGDIRRLGEDDN